MLHRESNCSTFLNARWDVFKVVLKMLFRQTVEFASQVEEWIVTSSKHSHRVLFCVVILALLFPFETKAARVCSEEMFSPPEDEEDRDRQSALIRQHRLKVLFKAHSSACIDVSSLRLHGKTLWLFYKVVVSSARQNQANGSGLVRANLSFLFCI